MYTDTYTYEDCLEVYAYSRWIPGGLISVVLFEGFLETGILQ